MIPAYGSTARSQDAAVLSRAQETGLPIVEANVGVSLIVSDGEVAAVRRDEVSVTLAEIAIPAARVRRLAERDAAEKEFLEWRASEMQRRYAAKRHRLGSAGSPLPRP